MQKSTGTLRMKARHMTKPKFDIQPNPYDKDYVDITADGKVVLREVLSKDAQAIVDKVKANPGKKK